MREFVDGRVVLAQPRQCLAREDGPRSTCVGLRCLLGADTGSLICTAGEAGPAPLRTARPDRLLAQGELGLAIAGTSHPHSAATMAVCSAYDDAHFNFNLVITIVLKYLMHHFVNKK